MIREGSTGRAHRPGARRRTADQIVRLKSWSIVAASPRAARSAIAAAVLSVALFGAGPSTAAAGRDLAQPIETSVPMAAAATDRPVVLAYYYIWFDVPSWERAKIDLPTLGKYDSADPAVIAQHVAWARAAGIDALIVSWKHEPRLDEPLKLLVEASRAAGLHLVLLYQGLDFDRNPIDPVRIADDLAWFMEHYGRDPVFDVFGKPAIIMSGTPSFDRAAIKSFRTAVDDAGSAYLLGSEREAGNYTALADLLDGDAYYWSSVDPSRDRNYQVRLQALADVIRADGGLWLAPVAPGFDARLIGGTRVIDRADGATYRTEWSTALRTVPDGLAIISWNEFSENSQIEPSVTFGSRYLEVTADLVRTTLGRPAAIDPASATLAPSSPGATASTAPTSTPVPVVSDPGRATMPARVIAVLAGLLVLIPIVFLGVRARRSGIRSGSGRR
ncbi:MAG: hypothetical protein ABI573_08170 [Chloroflexota bacterium]